MHSKPSLVRKPLVLLAFSACFFFQPVLSQDTATKPDKWEQRYQVIKDSLALLYPTLPAVASVLIKERQVEVNFYNALLTGNRYRNDNGDIQDFNFRQTYLFSNLQVNYGVSRNERLNVGVGIQFVAGRIDGDRSSSMFKIFSSSREPGNFQESAITAIIPRIRWRPFARNYNFTVQSSVSIPTGISTAKQNILGRNQVYWLNQFIYNYPLSDRFFLLSQLSTQYGFKTESAPGSFSLPLSVYLSHFIPRKTVLFALVNYVPVFVKDNNRSTFQAGAGIQYQLARQLLINGYYANDLLGKNYPDLSTYMIGLRYVTK